MVSRDQLLKYGAMLLIVVFVGETIFLGLSNASSSNPNGATPTPVSFSSSANASGVVSQLGFSGLAVCDASTRLDQELKNVSGVRTALFAASDVLAIQFEADASLDDVELTVAQRCGAPLFRSAGVDLSGQVYFNTSSGEQAISSRQLDAYFSSQGVNGFQAFVSPALKVGDAVNVTIFVVVQNDQFVSVTAQQPERDVLALFEGRPSDATPIPPVDVNASAPSNASSIPDSANATASNVSISNGST